MAPFRESAKGRCFGRLRYLGVATTGSSGSRGPADGRNIARTVQRPHRGELKTIIALRHSPPSVEEIMQWANDNPGYRFEYVNGEVTIVSPTTPASGRRTSAPNVKLGIWATANGYVSFGSSTLSHFSGLKVSPDEVLVRAQIFDALSPEEQEQIGNLVPDVAVEFVTKSQGQGKERRGVLPKCKAMHEARVGYVLMLDPYELGEERVTIWGVAPPNFPTDWDNVLNA